MSFLKVKIFILFLAFAPSVLCQIPSEELNLMARVGDVRQFNLAFPQEKVFLQFDNTSYFQGETIWFKAFVVNATSLTRTRSGVLYVDLLSPTGVLLQQLKLKIRAGQADGCFNLYDQSTMQARELRGILPYPSGYYEIRAYTQYMLNFDESIVFSRVIPVFQKPATPGYYSNPVFVNYNDNRRNPRPEPVKSKAVNVSFFPEGGLWVADIPSRMAFKATDENGQPIDGTLRISGSRNMGVIEAVTIHDGMGHVLIQSPQENMKAVFIYENKEYRVKLPEIQDSGITLSLDSINRDSLYVAVRQPQRFHPEYTYCIAVTCCGLPISFKAFQWESESSVKHFSFPAASIPLGVCKITLFGGYGAMSTRHFFNFREDFRPPHIQTVFDKDSYAPYEKVSLSLSLMNGQGLPFRDRFCISVRDAHNIETTFQDNLATWLLLSSDLKGLINNPQYYFESDDEEHRLAMDLLMMVQGWERYGWDIMSGLKRFEERHRMEDSLSVNGWVTSYWSNKVKLEGVKTYLTVAPQDINTLVQYGQQTTGSNGYFGFNVLDFHDKADLVMLLERNNNFAKNTGANLILERAFQPEIKAYDREKLVFRKRNVTGKTVSEKGQDMAGNGTDYDYDAIKLPEVEIIAPRKYIDYFTFKAFDVEKDVEQVMDFGEWTTDVLGYILDKGYTFTVNDGPNQYIDNYPVFWYIHDSEKLATDSGNWNLDTEDIESMLIFDEPASLYEISETVPLYMDYINRSGDYEMLSAMRGHSQTYRKYILVDIKMKDDYKLKSKKEKMNRGQRITTLQGFDYPVQFYIPQYPDGPIEGTKDYRRTLYWNPNVITDEEGNAHVEFYNNSYSTNFTVTGAGITASGTPYVLDADF